MNEFIDQSDIKEEQPSLGRTVKVLREREGLTPSALAEKAKVDLGRLEQIEAGEGGDYNTVVYIRRALGVSARRFTELHEAFARGDFDDAD